MGFFSRNSRKTGEGSTADGPGAYSTGDVLGSSRTSDSSGDELRRQAGRGDGRTSTDSGASGISDELRYIMNKRYERPQANNQAAGPSDGPRLMIGEGSRKTSTDSEASVSSDELRYRIDKRRGKMVDEGGRKTSTESQAVDISDVLRTIRAEQSRSPAIEGQTGDHSDVLRRMSDDFSENSSIDGRRLSEDEDPLLGRSDVPEGRPEQQNLEKAPILHKLDATLKEISALLEEMENKYGANEDFQCINRDNGHDILKIDVMLQDLHVSKEKRA